MNQPDVPDVSLSGRVAREVERERNERTMNDEARAGLAPVDEFRTKDARENPGASQLKRALARWSPGRDFLDTAGEQG